MLGKPGRSTKTPVLAELLSPRKMNVDTDTQWAYWEGYQFPKSRSQPLLDSDAGASATTSSLLRRAAYMGVNEAPVVNSQLPIAGSFRLFASVTLTRPPEVLQGQRRLPAGPDWQPGGGGLRRGCHPEIQNLVSRLELNLLSTLHHVAAVSRCRGGMLQGEDKPNKCLSY